MMKEQAGETAHESIVQGIVQGCRVSGISNRVKGARKQIKASIEGKRFKRSHRERIQEILKQDLEVEEAQKLKWLSCLFSDFTALPGIAGFCP